MRLAKAFGAILTAWLGFFLSPAQAQRTATATATTVNGFVVGIVLTDGGSGYTNAPAVTISGGGGSGATATAKISTNGIVLEVVVENTGRGYTTTPTVTFADPPPGKPPFSDGLVAYYPFNGNADDESGNGNNGLVLGAVLTTNRFGVSNSAFRFNVGLLSAIQVKNPNIPFGAAERTISVWCNIDGIDMNTDRAQYLYGYGVFNGGGSVCASAVNQDKVIYFIQQGSGHDYWRSGLDNDLFDKQWHMITFTITSNSASGYCDGKKFNWNGFPPPGTTLNTMQSDLYIGYFSGFYFDGLLDDFRIYNRVLSDQEIEDLYNYEAPIVPEQPVLTIDVKQVRVNMAVKQGRKYQLESSGNLSTWTTNGVPFIAPSSRVTQDFDVTTGARYFRLYEVQP